MATFTIHRLGFRTARHCICAFSSPSRNVPRRSIAARRPFSASSTTRARKREDDDELQEDLDIEPDERNNFTASTPRRQTSFLDSLAPSDRVHYDSLSSEEKSRFQQAHEALRKHMSSPRVDRRISAAVSDAVYKVNANEPPPPKKEKFRDGGFMSDGEEDEEGTGADDEFKRDDISSLAHSELEQHREMREYARLAAWEMPLLSKLAKPFQPPAKDQVLRFRYTTYMGEEHPAEKKVVVQFSPSDMPDLTQIQREKLIKLVGPRYNPDTGIVKMSCEMFETQAQNKRYLGDLVDTLLNEARDPTDTFEDVPFDFRHHKHKVRTKPKFPVEWRMTPARRAQLDALRAEREAADKEREAKGELLDGAKVIQEALEAGRLHESNRRPVLEEVVAQRLGKGRAVTGRRAPRMA